jgi:hypothetical protein
MVIEVSEETERRTSIIPRLTGCLDGQPEFFLARLSDCVTFPKFDDSATSLIGNERPDATAASACKKPSFAHLFVREVQELKHRF